MVGSLPFLFLASPCPFSFNPTAQRPAPKEKLGSLHDTATRTVSVQRPVIPVYSVQTALNSSCLKIPIQCLAPTLVRGHVCQGFPRQGSYWLFSWAVCCSSMDERAF